mmetsp:Transcript_28721/g.75185  ORF Transcript_28721/g.75185 Transcript_28721/m.75185 type:complete len:256 (+) Transcript_28721:224-991(+)
MPSSCADQNCSSQRRHMSAILSRYNSLPIWSKSPYSQPACTCVEWSFIKRVYSAKNLPDNFFSAKGSSAAMSSLGGGEGSLPLAASSSCIRPNSTNSARMGGSGCPSAIATRQSPCQCTRLCVRRRLGTLAYAAWDSHSSSISLAWKSLDCSRSVRMWPSLVAMSTMAVPVNLTLRGSSLRPCWAATAISWNCGSNRCASSSISVALKDGLRSSTVRDWNGHNMPMGSCKLLAGATSPAPRTSASATLDCMRRSQ